MINFNAAWEQGNEQKGNKGGDKLIRITDNDLLLFKYLFESESDFLTREQIRDYLWSDFNEHHVKKRLWQLTKEEYLKKKPDPTSMKETVLMCDKKALDYIRLDGVQERLKNLKRNDNFKLYYLNPEVYKVKDEIDLRQYDHDRMLNTLRFIFENNGANYWLTSKLIYRKKLAKKTPDALFHDNKKLYAIELENTLKQKHRYKDIFATYAQMFRGKGLEINKNINKVLYITTSDSIYKSLQKKINSKFISYSKDSYKNFFVAKLEDIKENNFKFHNNTLGKYISLG